MFFLLIGVDHLPLALQAIATNRIVDITMHKCVQKEATLAAEAT